MLLIFSRKSEALQVYRIIYSIDPNAFVSQGNVNTIYGEGFDKSKVKAKIRDLNDDGTMGSAKTAMLLTTAYNFEERGMDYICMKPIVDNREKDSVIRSRIGIERRCSWIYPESDMYKMLTEVFDTEGLKEWILIDEAQFLSPEQVDQLARIVDNFGVNVLCYGLRTDFQSHLFDGSRRLFEIADTIDEVKSTCTCGRKTIINARIDRAGNVVMDGEQVEIGGNDKYMAMCRRCWAKRRCERDRIESLDFGDTEKG